MTRWPAYVRSFVLIHGAVSLENKTICVRRDNAFGNHYNDQYTGFRKIDQASYSCDLYTGRTPGSNVLYARGGIGNRLHCMAALQRIDRDWRVFDAHQSKYMYMSDEFLLKRVMTSLPSNIPNVKSLRAGENIWLFPPCQSLVVHNTPCNCWYILALQSDTCGRNDTRKYQRDQALGSLRDETVAAFANIPISQDLRTAAARILKLRTIPTSQTSHRSIIGVHTRINGHLGSVDGNKVPLSSQDFRAAGNASLRQASFSSANLISVIRREVLLLFESSGVLPIVILASDDLFVAHTIRDKIVHPSFLILRDIENEEIMNEFTNHPAKSAKLATAFAADDNSIKVYLTSEITDESTGKFRERKDMLEMLLLSHSDVLIKDNTFRESTYSEAAWWLGGARAKRVHVPYPRNDILPDCLREDFH